MNSAKINEAVAFLNHPDVRPMSDEAKREFLRSKGLSVEEIEAAYVEAQNRELAQRGSFFSVRNLLALGTGAYLAYRAVRGVMEWLTAEEAQRSSVAEAEAAAAQRASEEEARRQQKAEDALEEMRARLAAQEAELRSLRTEMAGMSNLRASLQDTTSQLESLRKTVLSKNSFPAPAYLRPAGESSPGPGLPAWQLSQKATSEPVEETIVAKDAAIAMDATVAKDAVVAKDATVAQESVVAEDATSLTNAAVPANGDGPSSNEEDVD